MIADLDALCFGEFAGLGLLAGDYFTGDLLGEELAFETTSSAGASSSSLAIS